VYDKSTNDQNFSHDKSKTKILVNHSSATLVNDQNFSHDKSKTKILVNQCSGSILCNVAGERLL